MDAVTNGRRSTREIRASLHRTRRELERDLMELEERMDVAVTPRNILSRHPALLAAAGAALGFVVIRNPAVIGRTLTRVAQASAPFLLRTLFQRVGGAAAAQLAEKAIRTDD